MLDAIEQSYCDIMDALPESNSPNLSEYIMNVAFLERLDKVEKMDEEYEDTLLQAVTAMPSDTTNKMIRSIKLSNDLILSSDSSLTNLLGN